MKILTIVPYFDEPHRWMISGQKSAHGLAKSHQVIVVTTGQRSTVEQLTNNLKVYRIKDWFLKDPINYSIIPGFFRKLRKIITQERPDVALINKHMFYSSLAIWPLKKAGLQVVVQTDTFPGLNWFPKSRLVGAIMTIYARIIGNSILRVADKVVLLHEGLIPIAQQLGLKYEVIHSGIDLKEFDSFSVPADLKKRRGEIWVGYVGRLESVKGWYNLAAVALKMVRKNPKLHFFFVGSTKNAEEKMRLFTHAQIHFLGARNDALGIHKLFDIFVMPSLSEGLSNAIMEAMAAGSACLVSKVGGNIILIQDRVNGRLFEPNNLKSLHKNLEELVNDKQARVKFGRAARKTIEQSFNLSNNLRQLTEVLSN